MWRIKTSPESLIGPAHRGLTLTKGETSMPRRIFGLSVCLGLLLLFGSSAAQAQYQVTNLVSNQAKTAKTTDPLLVNSWGLAYGPTSPFWISDEGSGWSTLYNGAGVNQGLAVTIPTAGGSGPGSPTGIVFSAAQGFTIKGFPAIFSFATLDGTVSGWAPGLNFNAATIGATVPGAVYTGLAVTNNASGNWLYAADNAGNKVDVFDENFNWVTSFTDSTIPSGFSAFGIQDFGGLVYVTFAGAAGATGGYIDIFGEDGTFLKRVASGTPLNQPWGLAIAPKNFGPLSNTLLVSNNTNSGTINAFNAITGQFVGTVKDANGATIHINQLWGIVFGGGTPANGNTNQLFFTSGPDNNQAGLFGFISFKQTTTSN
jgi:uncharacterized protein (TIGR03118 family)